MTSNRKHSIMEFLRFSEKMEGPSGKSSSKIPGKFPWFTWILLKFSFTFDLHVGVCQVTLALEQVDTWILLEIKTTQNHHITLNWFVEKEKYRLSYRWSPSVDSSPLLCKFFNLEAKEKLLPCLNQIFANKCYFFSFSSDTKNIWYFFLNSYLINPPSSKPHEHLPEATSALRFHLGAASVCCQVLTQHSTIMGHFNLF